MSLKSSLEQIKNEPFPIAAKAKKLMKKFRNKWLRRTKLTETPNTKIRKGWFW